MSAASSAGGDGHADKSYVPATAELALALMLDLARGVSESTLGYRNQLAPPQRSGRQLRGRTAGIIGYGAIGSYLSDLLRSVGVQVVVCAIQRQCDDRWVRPGEPCRPSLLAPTCAPARSRHGQTPRT